MPENDIVQDEWAHDARAAFEAAIKGWNGLSPKQAEIDGPIEVVWGHGDFDSAELAAELMRDIQMTFGDVLPKGVTCPIQSGCLFMADGEAIEIAVNWNVGLPSVALMRHFDRVFTVFPADGSELFNSLQLCRTYSTNPMTCRGDGRDIELYGVVIDTRIRILTPESLDDALYRLLTCATYVYQYLETGEGQDFWNGIDHDDDDEEEDDEEEE